MGDPIYFPPPFSALSVGGAVYIGDRHGEDQATAYGLFLGDDGRIYAGNKVGPGGRWLTLGEIDTVVPGVALEPFVNLSFDAGVSGWEVVSIVPPAEPPGFISLGNGSGPLTATLRQKGRRITSSGQQVTIGIRAQFHGTSSDTYGVGHASENVTLKLIWFKSDGLELSEASSPVKNGAGLVGWQDIALTAHAPILAASYTIEVLVDISVAGAVVDLDTASYNDPNGSA